MPPRLLRASLRFAFPLAVAASLAACSDDDPSGPGADPTPSLTVDTNDGWAFVSLGPTANVVQVSDPSASDAWDIAFNRTDVMLNGGAAGPGVVEGFCICQNANATDAQIIAMNPGVEAAAFEAVTLADLPADEDAWVSDVLAPAIEGWWNYDINTHTLTAATNRAWLLRTAEAEGGAFAKLRVTQIANATQQNAGEVTLQFAIQPAAGEAFGATQTLTVDVSEGPVYVDLLDAAVSDASDWDLRLEGFDIRLNSGVSGSGKAGALLADTAFDEITDASGVASLLKTDGFGGAFDANPWYRYNLQGNHQIWPNFNVYLVRVGGEVYKVQITGYYHPTTGDDRQISFRYARLEN